MSGSVRVRRLCWGLGCQGGHGPARSAKFWCISVRHGHGTAVN